MNLIAYRQTLTQPLRQATLVFLVRSGEVLLAMKKRGLGEGLWNGVGGKVLEGETVEEAAIRETVEEIGARPTSLLRVATLEFYCPHQRSWEQQVLVFLADKWEGEPAESEEMRPQWFNLGELPFDSMWPDDPHWLPKVLEGLLFEAEFLFGEGDKILEFEVREISGGG